MGTQVTYSKARKRMAAVIAVVLTGAILAGGTFAWQSLNQQARNNAKGENGPAGGRLHDDYEVMGDDFGKEEWTANLTANKDIYVENYETEANNGRDIFVRVRLYEYMEIGAGAHEEPAVSDGSTPTPTPNAAYDERDAVPLIADTNRDNVTTWSPRVPGTDAASDAFRSYWNWSMGGQKTYMPTFNKDNYSKETDIKGDAVDPGTLDTGEQMNTTNPGGTKAYDEDAGLHTYFETTNTYSAQEKLWNPELGAAGEHTLTTNDITNTSKTTQTATVITMEEWMGATYNSQKGNFWVIDADGWCYWANPIPPETATGLLLNSITLQRDPDHEWYYSIYVKSQMATAADWQSTADGMGFYADTDEAPSEEAEDLLTIITASDPEVRDIELDPAAVVVNESLTLDARVNVENTNDPAWEAVTWTIRPDTQTREVPEEGQTLENGIFTPTAEDENKWFTIRATSVKDEAIFAESKIYVPPSTLGVVKRMNEDRAIYYVDYHDNTYQEVKADGTLGALICPTTNGEPGGNDDRTNVTTIGGVHYLDEGDGKYYLQAGDDGLLGIGDDDVRVYEEDGVMKPADTAVTLAVSAESYVIAPGETSEFTASATLDGQSVNVDKVTWELIGTHVEGTSITSPGETVTLTVAGDETATRLTVRATYPGDYGASVEKTVYIGSGPAAEIPVGGTFKDGNNVLWLVLEEDEQGHKLIMTKYVYGLNENTGTKYNPDGDIWSYLDTEGNNLKSKLQEFYSGVVGDDIKAVALAYQSPLPDVRSDVDAGTFSASEDDPMGYSHAGGEAATENGSNAVFVLSVSEVNGYLGDKSSTIVKDNTIFAESKVYVPPSTLGVATNEDGTIYYVDYHDNTYQEVKATGSLGALICPTTPGKPGGSDDRTNVTTINGVHYLDEGDGKHYIQAGENELLGTDDDERVYEDGDVMKPAESAVTLVITPESASAAPGDTKEITASVTFEGTSMSVEEVTWELVGTYVTGTGITSPGGVVTLTVAQEETAANVTVRATYPGAYGVSVEKSIAIVADHVLPSFEDDNDVEWLVLKEEGGHKLIMTRYVYGFGTQYSNSNTWEVWNDLDTPGENLKSVLETFYTDNVGANVKAAAVAYESPLPDIRSTYGGTGYNSENKEAGWSHAGTDAAAPDGSNAVFVLSVSEANEYLGAAQNGKIAYDVTATDTACGWWLRSPGSSADYPVSIVTRLGNVGSNQTTYDSLGYRPALWIKSDS